jgi:hypothetical protein
MILFLVYDKIPGPPWASYFCQSFVITMNSTNGDGTYESLLTRKYKGSTETTPSEA